MNELSGRFIEAIEYAMRLHAKQTRKGTNTPYISHLLSVSALVLEYGGDEDLAIAALLHDAVEDQGGSKTFEEIQRRFGERVAHIINGCTDTYITPKPPWRQRKEEYIIHLTEADEDIRFISLADKLHNARSILVDLREEGDCVWERFNGGKEGTLWYYRTLVDVFSERSNCVLANEFANVVNEIVDIARLDHS